MADSKQPEANEVELDEAALDAVSGGVSIADRQGRPAGTTPVKPTQPPRPGGPR